jgi:hypothetical protein
MINIALFMYFQTLDLMGLHLLLNNLEPPTKEALKDVLPSTILFIVAM